MHELPQLAEPVRRDDLPGAAASLDADPAVASCPWCAERRADSLWRKPDAAKFWLQRCSACRLIYTMPQLRPDQIAGYYPRSYYGDQNVRFNGVMEGLVGWFRRRRAARLRNFRKEPGNVLDIGCGRGHFLDWLRSWGWTCTGTELTDAAAYHAREILGLDVRVGAYEPGAFPEAAYDAVYLWHVLEHLPVVRTALSDMRRILRPDGMLVIAVPNLSSWQAQLCRYGWFHLDLPRHYAHFTTDWLLGTLRELGFTIVEVNHFSLEQNVYGWIQSLLNCAGLKQNLLYELLKRRAARQLERPLTRFPFQSLLSMLGAAVLLVPAVVAMLVEAAFGRGGTIEVYAKRS
jgi:2-polyprenyl-3-methyl-5-hydroxy-6-metoxy-1,4-benzoquinol methylase